MIFDSGAQKYIGKEDVYSFSLSIKKIFETGENVLLLGDAGSGKTTTLQVYVKEKIFQTSDFYIYVPLVSLMRNRENKSGSIVDQNEELEMLVLDYLRVLKIDYNVSDFSELILDNKIVLLLDGLDEVVGYSPWIVNSILVFSEKYPSIQLISSSRMSGEYVSKMPYLSITLLPFSDDQIYDFIKGWYRDRDRDQSEVLIRHIKANPDLLDVVRLPLNLTIFCVLNEYNIRLPDTEVRLYDERFRLLMGMYDAYKGAQRIKSDYVTIEYVARKIAFSFHLRKKRWASKDEILLWIKEKTKKIDNKRIILAVDELLDPCNILIPMTCDGQYGFGHLKYQEYLVAKELLMNRGLNIYQYMAMDWWSEVFALFANMNDDFDMIINDDMPKKRDFVFYKNIKSMIEARPAEEKIYLTNVMKKHATGGEQYDDNELEDEDEVGYNSD